MKASVDLLLNVAQFKRGAGESVRAVKLVTDSVVNLDVKTVAGAQAQVRASAVKIDRLRAEAAAYRQAAAAATAGSTEQIAASNLAARAESRLAAMTGATAAKMTEAAAASGHAERSILSATKGALAGSGAFEHLGRSLAFAGGGFIAFEGVSAFLRDSVDAARDAGTADRSLAAQMKAVGQSFQASQPQIEKAALSVERFGFTSEDSIQALTVLERGTGKIGEALRLQGEAADLARAKNVSLSASANVLAKVFGGQETALRRAVPGLDQNAHGLDLIRLAGQKLRGQAAANTTEAQRFAATLHDTEVIIGTALLPVLNKYLGELGTWLDKMNRSGQLQRDVNSAVKTGEQVIAGITALVKPAAAAFTDLGKAVGGTKNEIELLVGAFAAFKTAKLLGALGLAEGAVARIGGAAVAAGTEVDGLSTKLGLLAKNPLLAVAGLTIADVLLGKKALTTQATAGDAAASNGSPYPKGTTLNDLFQAGLAGKSGVIRAGGGTMNTKNLGGQEAAAYLAGVQGSIQKFVKGLSGATGTTHAGMSLPGKASGQYNRPVTAQQNLDVALAADPTNVALLQQEAAHDRAAIAFANKLHNEGRISNQKWHDEVIGYENDLTSTLSTIASTTKKAADTAAKAKAKLPLLHGGLFSGTFTDRDLAKLRLPGKISGSLPGESYSLPPELQLMAAKAAAGIGSTTAAAAEILRYDKKLLATHRLSIQGQIDVYNDIANQNQVLGSAAKQAAHAVSATMLTAGNPTRKELEGRLALAGAFSGHVPTAMGVLGQSVVTNHNYFPNVRDAHAVADKLTKLGQSKPTQTTGPNAGRNRALP